MLCPNCHEKPDKSLGGVQPVLPITVQSLKVGQCEPTSSKCGLFFANQSLVPCDRSIGITKAQIPRNPFIQSHVSRENEKSWVTYFLSASQGFSLCRYRQIPTFRETLVCTWPASSKGAARHAGSVQTKAHRGRLLRQPISKTPNLRPEI